MRRFLSLLANTRPATFLIEPAKPTLIRNRELQRQAANQFGFRLQQQLLPFSTSAARCLFGKTPGKSPGKSTSGGKSTGDRDSDKNRARPSHERQADPYERQPRRDKQQRRQPNSTGSANSSKNSKSKNSKSSKSSKMSANSSVRHDKARKQFTMELEDGSEARIEYKPLTGNKIDMYHTEVPAELRGRGIARALARGALERAADERLKVKLSCSYLINYLDKFADERLKRLVVEK